MFNKSNQGFTLIELMVVILIIAILGALGLVSYGQANQSARDGKRIADIESVRQALLLYRQENGSYPPHTGSSATAALFTSMNNTITDYIETVSDPVNTSPYQYIYRSTSSHAGFCVCARLQSTSKANSGANCNFGAATKQYYCKTEP